MEENGPSRVKFKKNKWKERKEIPVEKLEADYTKH